MGLLLRALFLVLRTPMRRIGYASVARSGEADYLAWGLTPHRLAATLLATLFQKERGK
jgi:hypothetical protein